MSSTGLTPPPFPPPLLLLILLILLLLLLLLFVRLAMHNPTTQHHLNTLPLPHPTPKIRWVVKKSLDERQIPPASVRLMDEATQGATLEIGFDSC